MGLVTWLKEKNRKEQFKPGLFGIIFNPYYFNRRAIYQGIKKHSGKLKGQLLDFGCGTKPYEYLFNVDNYSGIDLEENKGHNIPKHKTDFFYKGDKLPFEDNSFDSLYSSEVFEHVFNLDEILKDINRVHRPGGFFLITMPFVWREHEMPNDFGRYTSAGIAAVLKRNNYKIIVHEKEPGFYLSVVQLFAVYVYHAVLPKSTSLKFLLSPFTIFPINLFAMFFNLFLPTSKELYINHVIVAENTKFR